jgi:hypothetical protein
MRNLVDPVNRNILFDLFPHAQRVAFFVVPCKAARTAPRCKGSPLRSDERLLQAPLTAQVGLAGKCIPPPPSGGERNSKQENAHGNSRSN